MNMLRPVIRCRLWLDHWKLRLLIREIRSTADDIQDARMEGEWTRARALGDYAIELATERRRLNWHINHLTAKRNA